MWWFSYLEPITKVHNTFTVASLLIGIQRSGIRWYIPIVWWPQLTTLLSSHIIPILGDQEILLEGRTKVKEGKNT